MFFRDWFGLVRILCLAPLAYAVLVITLRISGKRTLAKMNAFDLVVTVALGSTLASVITSSRIPLAEGALSLLMLVLLQYLVSLASLRSGTVTRVIKSEPRLLFHQGRFIEEAMRRERVIEEDVLQAMRSQGLAELRSVAAVVLETDGTFSIVQKGDVDVASERSTLRGVRGVDLP